MMSAIFRDVFLRNLSKAKIEIKSHVGILHSYGELADSLKFGHYILEPYDQTRNFHSASPQRLKVTIKHAEPEGAGAWNPQRINDEIGSLLSLASGRTVISKHDFLLTLDGKEELTERKNRTVKHHTNLFASIESEEAQRILNKIWLNIQQVKTQESSDKLCVLIKAVDLYQSSLEVIPHNYEAAYILLVSSAETVGRVFSSVSPTLEDLPQKEKFDNLFHKYDFGDVLKQELLEILFAPDHIKLQAKFKDVITSNLNSDFFDVPPLLYVPKGKDFSDDGDSFTFLGWQKEPDQNWAINKSEIKKLLDTIYQCRSQFVHAGEEFPYYSKLTAVSSGIQPLKVSMNGEAKKDKDGRYSLEKKVMPYFWFERVMNNVLINLFDKL
jgi:DNA-directed RNA polymerase subunit F